MLRTPLFYLWIGWVLAIGVIAMVRGVHALCKLLMGGLGSPARPEAVYPMTSGK